MNILIIADPHITVPPKEYGGAERIIAQVATEFETRGHTVTLIAAKGSRRFTGGLVTHAAPSGSFLSRAFRKLWFQIITAPAVFRADVIWNSGRLDYLLLALWSNKPIIITFHNPIQQKEIDWILARRSTNIRIVGVSRSQVEGLTPPTVASVIHNSTDTTAIHFHERSSQEPYLAFLGRLTKNKGLDTAINVARRSGMKLRIGGTISSEPGGREFFEEKVRPQLDTQIEWVGPVDDIAKEKLLGGASALLFPIRWKEPCAVVLSESLACGTPIIATRLASTPEVIDDGITGFLCDSEDEMVEAVARIPQIDRTACRRSAEERFSIRRMADNYLALIEELHCKAD